MEQHAALFEEQRPRLKAVAYRMLGSLNDADDVMQEAWLRYSRSDTSTVANLAGWLTRVVARLCLDALRSRKTRSDDVVHIPDPIVSRAEGLDPEQQTLIADSVGLALVVVLETLGPAERLAFVLHDMFSVPFDEIAEILACSSTAARQLASRGRRRVRDAAPVPDVDLDRQREVVDAFFAAAREGNFEALVAVLDPDIVLRSDGGMRRAGISGIVRGPQAVASQALTFSKLSPHVRPAIINGTAGVVVAPDGRPFCVMAFIVRGGKVVAIDSLVDPDRLRALGVAG